MDQGYAFWEAAEKNGLFQDYALSLVKLGEESGQLAENLKIIAEQDAKEKVLKSKVKKIFF